jgi:arabinan endo-1,5-alpha-L-arabinosidase
MRERERGLAVLLLCAWSAGCLPDPKKDPCRHPATRPASCEPDAGRADDAGRDGRPDASLDGEAPDADAALDAEPGPGADVALDAGVDAAADSAVDGGMEDAEPPPVPRVLELEGDLHVHDPTIIEVDGSFIIFSTGPGVPVKRSHDLLTWEDDGRVFAANPTWVGLEVPGATDLWAPDIAYYGGKYHLYYSASTFGSRNSCIGHATATDLTLMDFVDQGPVICTEESDDFNAIDPGFIVDEQGDAWLSFGSFWSGIKLIPLDANGQRKGADIYAIASRDVVQAIEAPYLVRRGGYYYLFVSFDLCCRGATSTYRIMVGRAEDVTGPYFDASDKPMLSAGGGTGVVVGNQRWRGPGHNSVLTVGDAQYLVYHAYDAQHGGAPTLRIAELLWDGSGWPVPTGP